MTVNLIETLVGGLLGLLFGVLLNVLSSWRKDMRDRRLREQGLPLPSDRVSGKYHWIGLIVGLLTGFYTSMTR